jgi:hypothetical protein
MTHPSQSVRFLVLMMVAACGDLTDEATSFDDESLDTTDEARVTCPPGTHRQGNRCISDPACGDGTCNPGEDCSTCTADCGSCATNGCATSSATWQSSAFASQSGKFTARFDATPSQLASNALVGLSPAAATGFADLAAIVRFNNLSRIDARNGSAYAALSAISYTAGRVYHFRLAVDVAAKKYDAYVTPDGGAELAIGTAYSFRTEQAGASQLATWSTWSDAGSVSVCNFEAVQVFTGCGDALCGAGEDCSSCAADCGACPPPTSGTPSVLWGLNGEKWTASGRLPDFSYAGYQNGEKSIPVVPVMSNVRNFGALGDGLHDDTQAFVNAISGTASGAILVPAGTYRLTSVIYIKKPGIVLRGEGPAQTVLKFERSLTDALGPNLSGVYNVPGHNTSNWSWDGGMIWAQGTLDGSLIGTVTVNAARGAKTLTLSSVTGLTVGSVIRLHETDPAAGTTNAGTLLRAINGYLMDGPTAEIGKTVIKFASRITAINGSSITLERPIPFELKTIWSPKIYRLAPTVKEVGIEHLQIKFPDLQYPGHWLEVGYNGIQFKNVAHSWVDDVVIHNSDSGIYVQASTACTIRAVTLTAYAGRPDSAGVNGHHGLSTGGSTDVLFTGFSVPKKFHHDLTLDHYPMLNVFENGQGVNLNMDHHGGSVASNLFTNISLGAGSRPWASGGAAPSAMPHTGAYATFWNLRAATAIGLPGSDYSGIPFGPLLNFVGIGTSATSANATLQWHLETMAPSALTPQNLRQAQLQKRLTSGGAYP